MKVTRQTARTNTVVYDGRLDFGKPTSHEVSLHYVHGGAEYHVRLSAAEIHKLAAMVPPPEPEVV